MRRLAVPAVLWRTISRMGSTDSCLAESMKEQVLTTRISASSGELVKRAPARSSRPIMTSESTRFLGQPNEIKPTEGAFFGSVGRDVLLTLLLYRGIGFGDSLWPFVCRSVRKISSVLSDFLSCG